MEMTVDTHTQLVAVRMLVNFFGIDIYMLNNRWWNKKNEYMER